MTFKLAGGSKKISTGPYYVRGIRIALVALLLMAPLLSLARNEGQDDDEISVTVEVKNVGSMDMPAIYSGKNLYISVTSLFNFIKINNIPSAAFDSISGFFMNEKDVYLIDEAGGKIYYHGTAFKCDSNGLIRTETALYMKLDYFKSVFGLDGTFNFRRLWVTFVTNDELPIIREMKEQELRKNMNRLHGDQPADTMIKHSNPFFHLGMADWAVLSTQQSQSYDDTRFTLGLGGVVAGGETNVSLNYYNRQPFSELQQYYQWRYVNNDHDALRQVALGKIFTQGVASLYAPVVGAQFTNAPTTNRRSYGTYLLSNTTKPNWIVELYVNDVLIDYKKADASGFYSFEVPLVYGYTIIRLKFYGPYGEVHTTQQYINIPFNFLPKHEFEYTVNGGIVEDGQNSRYSRVAMTYGLTNFLTLGGGMEYLSSVTSGAYMPFINLAARISRKLLISGEYNYGVRARAVLSYHLPSNFQIDLDYIKYMPGQTAIFYNYLEERKAAISMPIHTTGFSLLSRLTLDQITVPLSKYTNAELSFNGSIRTVGLNLTTYASFAKNYNPYFYSLLSGSCILPAKISFTGQVEYDYKLDKVAFMKCTFERYLLGKGYINVSYQEFFTGNTEGFTGNYYNLIVGLRYDFSFARVFVSALTGNNNTYSRMESASGSFIYDAKTNYFNVNNRTNVGHGGIVVEPFLDINCNGKWDDGEPRVAGLKIRVNGGRVVYSKDTDIRVFELEPYTDYVVELNTNSLDNVAWQIHNQTIKVRVPADNFALVRVPVYVVGEISGNVSIRDKATGKTKGQGQLIVNIYNSKNQLVAYTLTESDGYFEYMGLAPGKYTAKIDKTQLQKLHMATQSRDFTVRILKTDDGDIVDGINFVLDKQ